MKLSTIEPARGYVLGEVLTEDKLLSSGLWIATTTKKGIPPKRVKLIALGAKTRATRPVKVKAGKQENTRWILKYDQNGKPIEKDWHYKPGDTLYIKPGAGIPIWIDQKKHLFLRRGDVIGVDV